MEANRLPGDDVIMINAGINPTISRGMPDNDGDATNVQVSGDLDITCVISSPAFGSCDLPILSNQNDLVIMGAAGGNTVSAGTFTPYPVDGGGSVNTDRVFDVGQDGTTGGGFGGSTGVSATFTNLTIQNGNVREALNTGLGGGNRAFGGGIRYDGFRSGGGHTTLTLTNSTINNNQSDNAGGGVYHVFGSHTASTATYSNNITKAGEGGGLFFGAATSASNVNITGSQFVTNEARQGIVFGTFTANADGGGLRINAGTVNIPSSASITHNSASGTGGGISNAGTLSALATPTITTNFAFGNGGGIFNSGTLGAITLPTLSGNSAATGGGTFSSSGAVNFTGAAAQNIPALTYNNLTVNNASGVNLAGNTTVNGTLTLTSGNLLTGASVLTIGGSGTITRTSGHIIGDVEKIFTATGAFDYHVGTATGYSPVNVNITALANPSNLRVKANDGTAPAAPPLADATTLDRFWTLTETTGDLTANMFSIIWMQTKTAI